MKAQILFILFTFFYTINLFSNDKIEDLKCLIIKIDNYTDSLNFYIDSMGHTKVTSLSQNLCPVSFFNEIKNTLIKVKETTYSDQIKYRIDKIAKEIKKNIHNNMDNETKLIREVRNEFQTIKINHLIPLKLELEIVDNKAELNKIKKYVGAIETEVDSIQQNVIKIKEDIKNIEGEIKKIKKKNCVNTILSVIGSVAGVAALLLHFF